MTTYREAVYMCLDLLKGMSDDFSYTEEHIAYLIDKFRALILKQKYGGDPKKLVPYSNYQTLTVTLKEDTTKYLVGEGVPYMLQLGIPRIVSADAKYYNYKFEYVSRERFPFVGRNKFIKTIAYCAINDKNELLVQDIWSSNTKEDAPKAPEKLCIVGIFENPRDINSKENPNTDELDCNIPIEDALVTTLIEMVVKELATSVFRPTDDINNNSDDNANLASYLAKNLSSKWNRQLDKSEQ